MMTDEKKFREIADRNRASVGKTSNSEERLMLLRCQASFVGSRLAECLKFPKFVSESSEGFIVYRIRCVASI